MPFHLSRSQPSLQEAPVWLLYRVYSFVRPDKRKVKRVGMATPAVMKGVFPEALLTLQEADPEVFNIIEDEKARQWYVF